MAWAIGDPRVDHTRIASSAAGERGVGRRRLVIASNRVPAPGPDPVRAGGLVSALLPALEESGGLWFGWSGRVERRPGRPHIARAGRVDFVTVDLTADEIARYYAGFSNRTLWPVLHGLSHHPHAGEGLEYLVWRAVNRRFAEQLAPWLRPDDLVFVQDYHLIPFGRELRRTGWGGLLGYFHHVPMPGPEAWAALPHAVEIAGMFEHYDLVGVQTETDRTALEAILPGRPRGAVQAHPIGIDPARMRAMAAEHPADAFATLRDERRVIFGVDRLDYTKGIPWRLTAFEQLLERRPALAHAVRFVQWAAPSRETIDEYREERARIEAIAMRIAARHEDGAPVVLSIADRPRDVVAAALRDADVCVVTSLADGMNLVAKEFVAVQRPANPGVLVLSDSCGAAAELEGALLVRATNVASIEAALERALAMPLEERQRRWRSMARAVESNTAQHWLQGFLRALEGAGRRSPAPDRAALGA
ncbi:MAG: trehalose-6-phosphate synthase [Dehalococcoidia bacterium]